MAKKKIDFMCTGFRDGFQSVYGARVLTRDFIPAVEAAREAGITWFEAGGGARFQALYFYCNEDAFDMMDRFREAAGPDANLQTLARGTNVVGLESQSSDVIKLHADLFAKHGITTIRNFDALNDVHNLMYSGQCIAEAGLKHQVCVSMMELPPGCTGAHTPDFYMDVLGKIMDSGLPFDSVCFKDASGTSVPSKVHETIRRARQKLPPEISLHFHTHETAGISIACYMAALDGGADTIDLSMAPVSGGTCQPDIATMHHALKGTDYDLDIDIDKVLEAEEVFKDCMKAYFLPPEATKVEPMLPWSPMPGGALTANTQMLRDNNIMHKYPEIIAAMGEVVRLGGFGTSVTPVSQFYFQQAFNNVMMGTWNKIAEGYGKMVLGYFGKTPVTPAPEVVRIASEQLGLPPTDKTPLEINDADPSKGLGPARRRLQSSGLPETDENVFISATCKDKGIAYLKGEAKLGIRYADAPKKPEEKAGSGLYTVRVNGKEYHVQVGEDSARVNGKVYKLDVREDNGGSARPAIEPTPPPPQDNGSKVTAPTPGVVVRLEAKIGDTVQKDSPVVILEAMKMEVEARAISSGVIKSFQVSVGDQVAAGAELALIEPGGAT